MRRWTEQSAAACQFQRYTMNNSQINESNAARQSLYDWLQSNYAARFPITLQPDGVEIIVHGHLRVLADPCDEYGDTYLGIDCGAAGETHSHPHDMRQAVADLLDGRTAIGLDGTGCCSSMAHQSWFRGAPDELNRWETLVDADGVYTPEEYAAKLRVTLPPKELYFECPTMGRRMAESECVRLCGAKNSSCGACRKEPLNVAAIDYLGTELLKARQTPVRITCSRRGLNVIVHSQLRFELMVEGMDGDGCLTLAAERFGSMHYHPSGNEALEELIPFLKGRSVLVLKKGIAGRSAAFAAQEELREEWRKLTRGHRVWIADLRGVYDAKAYEQRLLSDA